MRQGGPNEAGPNGRPSWRGGPPWTAPVRLGVVGVGYWGPNLVRVLNELPQADVAAACDLRQAALDALRCRYPALRTTTDLRDLLVDPTLEAVAVATPVSTHAEIAAAALEAGKHVFVEKPLATSSSDAIELIELAARSGLLLMPGHTFLYSPPVQMIRNLIQSGALGEVYFVAASRVNLGLHQTDISVAWDLAPHDFSILRYWLEEMPSHVAALSRGCVIDQIPDVTFIHLQFPSGVIAHVELSWLAPGKLRRTAVVGSQKMVVYDDTSTEPVRIFDSGVAPRSPETFGEYLTYRTGDIVSPQVDGTEPLALELADFCASIRTGSSPRSSVEVGLDVVRLVEAVDRSLASNGAPVPTFDSGHPLTVPVS